MSSEYFTRTSLHLVRLKIFEWIKILRRHLHQIQGSWAGRNFETELREFTAHDTCTNAEMNPKSATDCQRTQLSNNKFINGILGGGEYAWPGLTVRRILILKAAKLYKCLKGAGYKLAAQQ